MPPKSAFEPPLPNDALDVGEEPVPQELLDGIPGQDGRFYDDMYNDNGAPADVVNDVLPDVRRAEPVPERPASGSQIDFSFIQRINDPNLTDEQARAEYENLPPALRYVYDRTADFSYNNQGSQTPAQLDPRDANRWLDEFYKSQSEQNSPKAVAETDAAFARAQRAFGATQKIDYAIKRIMGDGGRARYKSYVGAYSMSPLGMIPGTETRQFQTDLASLKALLGLAAAGETKGQGTVSNYERELYGAASSIGLDLANTEDSFEKTLLQIKQQNDAQMAENEMMLNRLQGKRGESSGQQQDQPSPSAAEDTRPRKSLMGSTYAVNPDGTLEKVAK